MAVRSITDIDDVAEALRHASRTVERDWQWIDRLLDEWLELTR